MGLLAQPTYWFNWDRDPDHKGRELAAYWTTLFDEIDWSTMSCCCDQPPAIYRYSSTGVYQRSTDGGVTWVDAPEYDYRNISTVFPPPSALGIDNTKCQAADGAVVILNEDVLQGLDNGAAVQAILEFIAAVLIFYLSAGTLATIAIGLFSMAAAIFGFGVASTKAAFTSTVLDQLRCSIFNAMDSNDSISAAGITALLIDINLNYTGIVKTSLYSLISAAGAVGITNMLRSNRGDPAADCSGCSCGSDHYEVFNVYGTLVTSDSSSITVDAVFLPAILGGWGAGVSAIDYTDCCIVSATIISGSVGPSSGWANCGEVPNPSAFNHVGLHGGGDDSMYTLISTVAFRVKFNFA